MEPYLIIVVLIIVLLVASSAISFLVRVTTGDSPNLGCKILARTIWSIDMLGNKISPLSTICDVLVPF